MKIKLVLIGIVAGGFLLTRLAFDRISEIRDRVTAVEALRPVEPCLEFKVQSNRFVKASTQFGIFLVTPPTNNRISGNRFYPTISDVTPQMTQAEAQKLINECAEGGLIQFAPGNYFWENLRLKNNISLWGARNYAGESTVFHGIDQPIFEGYEGVTNVEIRNFCYRSLDDYLWPPRDWWHKSLFFRFSPEI